MGVGRGRRRPADPPRSRATRLRSPGHRSSRRCPVRWGAQRASARSRPRRSRWATGCHQSWPAASSRGRAPGSTPDVFGVPESPARGGDDRVLGSARGARGGPRERRRANRTIWYDMGPLEPVRLARSILSSHWHVKPTQRWRTDCGRDYATHAALAAAARSTPRRPPPGLPLHTLGLGLRVKRPEIATHTTASRHHGVTSAGTVLRVRGPEAVTDGRAEEIVAANRGPDGLGALTPSRHGERGERFPPRAWASRRPPRRLRRRRRR